MQQFTHLTFPFTRAYAIEYMGFVALSDGTDNENRPPPWIGEQDLQKACALTIALVFPRRTVCLMPFARTGMCLLRWKPSSLSQRAAQTAEDKVIAIRAILKVVDVYSANLSNRLSSSVCRRGLSLHSSFHALPVSFARRPRFNSVGEPLGGCFSFAEI